MATRTVVLDRGSGPDLRDVSNAMYVGRVIRGAAGDTLVYPTPQRVPITNPPTGIELEVGQAYRFDPRVSGEDSIVAFIPAGEGPLLLKDLVPVDPSTLDPETDPGPAWFEALQNLQDGVETIAIDAAGQALADADIPGQVTDAVASDGTVLMAAQEATAAAAVGLDLVPRSDPALQAVTDHPDYAWMLVDPAGRVSELAIGRDGNLAEFAVHRLAMRFAQDAEAATRSDTARLVALGDSTVAQADWAVLAGLMPGLTVVPKGQSGDGTGGVAIRQGGAVVKTTAAGTIPASGQVALTMATSITPSNSRSVFQTHGTLAGVPGVLAGSGAAWTFTRDDAGDAVVLPVGTPFVSTQSLTERDSVALFQSGINDATFNDPNHVAGILAAYAAMIGWQRPRIKRFLVVSVLGRSDWVAGSSGYVRVMAMNAALQAKYPNNYIDLRRHIIDNGLALAGITSPTTADQAAIAADTLPPSLMTDTTHPNATCRNLVSMPFFRDALVARSWTP